MPDNLDRCIPEFDKDDARAKLAAFSREELIDMLIYAYKLRRVITKTSDEDAARLRRIHEIVSEPSSLTGMPDVLLLTICAA